MATAIAQETVRLKQAVKSTYRVAIDEGIVAGVKVPPRTVVQAYWHSATLATGPGIEEFRPEYWLSEDHRTCQTNDDPNSMQARPPHSNFHYSLAVDVIECSKHQESEPQMSMTMVKTCIWHSRMHSMLCSLQLPFQTSSSQEYP